MFFRPCQFVVVAVLTVALCVSDPGTAIAAQQPAADAGTDAATNPPPVAAETSNRDRDEEPPATAPAKKPAAKPAGKPAATMRLGGGRPEGKSVALPPGATLQEFLEWLQQRNGPDSAVNSVVLEGTADDKRAELTATMTVQILHDRGWVRIPIFLNEGQLSDAKHTFLGDSLEPAAETGNGAQRRPKSATDAAAAFSDVTQEAGYRWWFRGKGYHRLRLSLVVPVTKTVAQRRLRLKLPPLSAASTLSLRVDDPNLIVVPPKAGDARVTPLGKTASRIRVVGLGSELDLQWRTVANSRGRAPILQAQTSIVVDFTDESVVLTALQRVQVLNGSVSRVEVQLPAGYQALAATGKYVKNYQVDARNRATVEFSEPRSEWTEINWTLQRAFPAAGGNLVLQGFAVDRAKVQSGELAITRVQGLRVEKLDADNVAVHRIRAARFTAPEMIRDKSLSSAYRFLKQPFRLNLDVSRVQPHVTVDPTVRLNVSAGKIVLNATFRVDVSEEGGTVRDLEIHWPGWNAAGWKIQPLTADPLIERRTLNVRNDAVPIRLRLTGRRGGEFVISLSAERAIAPAKSGVEMRLPVLSAAASRTTTSRPTTLIVTREPNLTLDLTEREESPLTEFDANDLDGLTRKYRIADPAAALLTARIKAHPQRLRATTVVHLDAKPFGLDVRQHISLSVEYVPVGSVRFEVPPQLADRAGRVEFFDTNRRRLTTQQVASKPGQPLVEVRLDRPRRGTIEFVAVATHQLPKELAAGESASLAVPLVRVEGVKFTQVRVQAPADSKMELALPRNGWRRIPTLDGSPAWSSERGATAFSVRLTSPDVPRSRPFSVPRALVRVSVDSAGAARYRAQYQIAGEPHAVVVVLPAQCQLDAVFWDAQTVSGTLRNSRTAPVLKVGGRLLHIPAPTSQGFSEIPGMSRRLLTIDYHTAGDGSARWLPDHDFAAPRFPKNVWIEETAWQVILPRDQHLSSFGAAYTPEFFWDRTAVVWSRRPTAGFADPESWIGAAGGPRWTAAVDGNSYVFRRYGPAEQLSLQSMSRPLIVLIGAGLAWLVGILLVKFPRLRTLAVLLTAALGAAVAGLWFAAELQLLLQPAALGAALAIGIVGIDRMARRRAAPAVMTMAHPSDFVTGSRSNVAVRPRSGVSPGSDDATAIRPPAPPLSKEGTQGIATDDGSSVILSRPLGKEGIPGGEPSSAPSEARRQG